MRLLKKDLRLALSPLTPLFLLFSFMTLIPRYPILVGAFFVCLGVFYSFQLARESGDILYTVLLPIRKRDVVRGKFAFSLLFELCALVLTAILTALRLTVLRGGPYEGSPLMAANFVSLSFALLIFLCFNGIFLGGFFKTAYSFGKPFVFFAVAAFVLIGVAEALHHFPGLGFLNAEAGPELLWQLPILAAAIAAFVLGTVLARRRAERRFEALDL